MNTYLLLTGVAVLLATTVAIFHGELPSDRIKGFGTTIGVMGIFYFLFSYGVADVYFGVWFKSGLFCMTAGPIIVVLGAWWNARFELGARGTSRSRIFK